VIYAGGDCHDPSCIPEEWKYDTTIIFVGTTTGEGSDRPGIGYLQETEDMVTYFGKNNTDDGKKTIVVISAPGASVFPWSDKVDA
jgi:hypothetical protein